MQLDLPFQGAPDACLSSEPPPAAGTFLAPERGAPQDGSSEEERVEFVRVRKARRYILRVRPDGTLRVTIPRGGSRAEAIDFLRRHVSWVARERARVRSERAPVVWTHGSTILLDGAPHQLHVDTASACLAVRYAGRSVPVDSPVDVRRHVEHDLRQLARERLVPRLYQLADRFGLKVSRVTIRNQHSRWGSCSRSGAIALNFRLVQMPPDVRDYVLIHELMHLKQQNHGRRFWALVRKACPGFREAEGWLRREGRGLF